MKRKLKKFIAVFSVLICLVSVNLSLFTVGASANIVPAGEFSLRTLGAPVSVSYYVAMEDDNGFYDNFFGIINRPNVYYYDEDALTYEWFEGSTDYQWFSLTYSDMDTSAANIFLSFKQHTSIDTVRVDSPILFIDFNDLNNRFNFNVGMYSPSDALGNSLDSIVVQYWYTFVTGEMIDGELVLSTEVVRQSVVLSNKIDGYFVFPLFNPQVLTNNVISDYKTFGTSSGAKLCYLTDAGFSTLGVFSDYNYFHFVNAGANQLLTDYNRVVNDRFKLIYQAEEYTETIVFEDLSWTDWIVNSVGAFLDFEIIPGLSFAGMLGLLVGMSLFIVFLKIFAGG